MVTPLPEVRFRYADFQTLAWGATHLGPIPGDTTYDMVQTLELTGCHLRGGSLWYESGGPAGRTVGLTNTIFEGCLVAVKDLVNGGSTRSSAEQLTAYNNLFYNCDMWLTPLNGSTCAFVDNIFDGAAFHPASPAVVNNHDAYAGASPPTLQGASTAPPQSDKFPSSVGYVSGPLGQFYLPAGSSLLGVGSRAAGAAPPSASAGLYHFTSLATNQKQAGGTVNIGPCYLALVPGLTLVNNGPDAMDFLVSSVPVYSGPGNFTLQPGASLKIGRAHV